jgi:hypothetical protein
MEISMPDYTTRFSCRLDTGSTAMAARARRRFAAYQRLVNLTDDQVCFEIEADPMEDSPGGIWIHDEDGMGDPDHVIDFLLASARRLGLKGRWGFSWSYGCSRPVLDAFSGGACVLDFGAGTIIGDLNCGEWIDEIIQSAKRFIIHAPGEAEAGQGGYWSNAHGWSSLDQATIFTWSERKTFGLPASVGDDADWIEIGDTPEGTIHLPETVARGILEAVP